MSAAVIAMSNLVVPLRISFLAAATAPAIVPSLLPPLALGIACALVPVVRHYRSAVGNANATVPHITNPASLPVAFGFGMFYAAVLLLSAWLSQQTGGGGLLALAAISGLADADAITLSALRLFDTQAITPTTASAVIVMAFFTASLSKLATAAWLGGRALIRRAWAPIIIPVAATALGMLLVAWR